MDDRHAIHVQAAGENRWRASDGTEFVGDEFALLEAWAERGAEIERLLGSLAEIVGLLDPHDDG